MQTLPIYILVSPRTLLTDLAICADALLYANRFQEHLRFELHFIGSSHQVDSSIGLPFAGIQPLPKTLPSKSVVIIPGFMGDWAENAILCEPIIAWLRQLSPQQELICICAGSLLAAQAGLLKHKRCTTHHAHFDDLRRIEPNAVLEMNRIFVEDGQLLSSAGVTAGLDVTLHFIEKKMCAHCAATVAQHMVVYQRRASLDPETSPMLQNRNHLHPAIHRVQSAVLAEPNRPWRNDDMAAIACVSPRHLTRLFKQEAGILPHDYVSKIRLSLAEQLLAKRHYSQDDLAYRVGFSSAQQLRRARSKMN